MSTRGRVDKAFVVFWWIVFALGIIVKDEWLAGPAAFWIILDRLEHR